MKFLVFSDLHHVPGAFMGGDRAALHQMQHNDPLHAIVTLEGSTITIEGMNSSMFMGITREMTDNPPWDLSGRPVTPTIQSAKITLG